MTANSKPVLTDSCKKRGGKGTKKGKGKASNRTIAWLALREGK